MSVTARRLIVTAGFVTALSAVALGDIVGFGDFSGFSVNQDDSAAAPLLEPGRIGLTNRARFESRSIFYTIRQDITQFTASYTFEALGDPSAPFGACFVVQNSPGGPQTVARYSASGVTTKLGYTDTFGAFNRSSAVSMEYGSLTAGSSSTALYRDGGVGGGSSDTSPLHLFSGNPIDVTIVYNGTTLRRTFTDRVTGESFQQLSAVNIPSIVGGTTAYVGFVATSGTNPNTEQWLSNFTFAVPSPGATAVLGMMALGMGRRRRPK